MQYMSKRPKYAEICKIKLYISDQLITNKTCSLPSYFFGLFRKNMQMHINPGLDYDL